MDEIDPAKRRIFMQALRHTAHAHAAHLVTWARRDKSSGALRRGGHFGCRRVIKQRKTTWVWLAMIFQNCQIVNFSQLVTASRSLITHAPQTLITHAPHKRFPRQSNPSNLPLGTALRSLLNHHAFNLPLPDSCRVRLEPGKPVLIPAGSDTFESIGVPAGERLQAFAALGAAVQRQAWGKVSWVG